MARDTDQNLNKLTVSELEDIVEKGENLQVSTSRASRAQRILKKRRHNELVKLTKGTKDNNRQPDLSDLTIFYSWQSDLLNSTNRTFIENVLKKVVKSIREDASILVAPRMDKDTADVPGSPNIPATILRKIDQSSIFVADVSIINKNSKFRQTPNPNVVFETGYAMKSIGFDRILLVQNTFYGPEKSLPFDLNKNRVISYRCGPDDDKRKIRVELKQKLERALKLIIDESITTEKAVKLKAEKQKSKSPSILDFEKLLSDNRSPIVLERKLKAVIDEVLKRLNEISLYKYNAPVTPTEFIKRKQEVEDKLKVLLEIYFTFGRWANPSQMGPAIRQFERLVQIPEPDSYNEVWENLARYPGLLVFYAVSLGAIHHKNIKMLRAILKIKMHNRFTGEDEPFWIKTNVFGVLGRYKGIIKDERRYFPGSDDLFELFKPYFSELTVQKYEDIFDTLEYLISAEYGIFDMHVKNENLWVPTGSYCYRVSRRKIWEVHTENLEKRGEKWIYYSLFDLGLEKLKESFNLINNVIVRISSRVRW